MPNTPVRKSINAKNAFGNDALAEIHARVRQAAARRQTQAKKEVEKTKQMIADKERAWAVAKHVQDTALLRSGGGAKKGAKKAAKKAPKKPKK